jgi:hypothetical protein
MTNEVCVRQAYEIAELKDIPESIACVCSEPKTPPRDAVEYSIMRADGMVTG